MTAVAPTPSISQAALDAVTAGIPAAVAANAPVKSVNMGTGDIISTQMRFTGISTTAVTNTAAETSVIGSGSPNSSLVIPANSVYPGKAFRLRVAGQFTTPLTPGNLTAKIKLNATVIGQKVVSNLLSLATNADWSGDVLIVFRTIGANGTVVVGGNVTYDTGVQVPGAASLYDGVKTIDTTIAQTIDATATWAAASASRSIGTYLVSLEALN